ncbi:MAG TPA: type II CAAX endopeptidase family protein [Bryobacteraceae bacterium]|nr:type II CAAX endopeptidase family protein [Bryobacteraceae bacterium]
MDATIPADKLGVVLRTGFFIFLVMAGLILFAFLLPPVAGYLAGSAGSVFGAAAIANAISLRVFERRHLPAVGLNWHPGSLRNLSLGVLVGAIAAVLVLGLPLLVRAAYLEPSPDYPASGAAALFVSAVLLFGAFGEELLFRGYAFQILSLGFGRWFALILSSLAFGWSHMSNQNASTLGIVNTVGFGVVLGYAFFRSGDLWLAIGVHFGWNVVLPLAGVNLSGFTMGVTGYTLRWRVAEIWSGGSYVPEASVLTSAVILLLLAALRSAPVRPQRPLLADGREQEVGIQ